MNNVVLMWYNPRTMKNEESNFTLSEFEIKEGVDVGVVCVNGKTLTSLQLTRNDLNEEVFPCYIDITDGTRTEDYLYYLAEDKGLGWTDEGGKVSRESTHLVEQESSGVDFVARQRPGRQLIPMSIVAEIARRHFDYVIEYNDHVHADNRHGGKKL